MTDYDRLRVRVWLNKEGKRDQQLVYYYFLGRKDGMKPSSAMAWAFSFVTWWINKDGGCPVAQAPQQEDFQ